MNIEVANRLVQLRKKYGYSQEELAAKLGISRQAVSKWERAESSPDTDNLICLAKLYNCSLDDLLKTDDSVDDIISNNKDKNSDESTKTEYCNIGSEGIHIKDGDDEVHIDRYGIYVKDSDGEECRIGSRAGFHKDYKFDSNYYKKKKIKQRVVSILTLLVVVAYITIGAVYNSWHPGWIIFLLIPLIETTGDAIVKKSPIEFCFPVLATMIYLILGFYFDLWHPGWVIFLFIPVFYAIMPKRIGCPIKIKDEKNDEKDIINNDEDD